MSKKLFLIIFALFIVGIDITLYAWNLSLRAKEVPYLKDVIVHEMAFDKQGRLWTFGKGELRVYEEEKLIRTFTEKDSLVLAESFVEIKFDDQGRAWISSYGGPVDLAMFDGIQWSTILNGSSTSTKYSGVTALNIDPQGRVWVGISDQGLKIFDGQSWETYSMTNSVLTSNTIQAIAFDNQGQAWIGTWQGGLYIIDEGNWQVFNEPNSPILSDDSIGDIAFDKKGRVWINAINGISVFDGENWTNYPSEGGNIHVDYNDRVWATGSGKVFDGRDWKFYFDSSHLDRKMTTSVDGNGNVWIGTDKGVVMINPDSPQPVSYQVALASFIISSGSLIYLTILLTGIWFAMALNAWRNIGVGLIGFLIYLLWILFVPFPFLNHFSFSTSDLIIDAPKFLFSNPGTFGTLGGIIGGFAEKLIPTSKNKPRRWAWLGLIIGSVLSFCVIFPPMVAG